MRYSNEKTSFNICFSLSLSIHLSLLNYLFICLSRFLSNFSLYLCLPHPLYVAVFNFLGCIFPLSLTLCVYLSLQTFYPTLCYTLRYTLCVSHFHSLKSIFFETLSYIPSIITFSISSLSSFLHPFYLPHIFADVFSF